MNFVASNHRSLLRAGAKASGRPSHRAPSTSARLQFAVHRVLHHDLLIEFAVARRTDLPPVHVQRRDGTSEHLSARTRRACVARSEAARKHRLVGRGAGPSREQRRRAGADSLGQSVSSDCRAASVSASSHHLAQGSGRPPAATAIFTPPSETLKPLHLFAEACVYSSRMTAMVPEAIQFPTAFRRARAGDHDAFAELVGQHEVNPDVQP